MTLILRARELDGPGRRWELIPLAHHKGKKYARRGTGRPLTRIEGGRRLKLAAAEAE
jgi:hypothetical protein